MSAALPGSEGYRGRERAAVSESFRMLVLTRKPKQSIMIGDDVEVILLAVSGEKVRLGIQAPSDVPVHRTEIYLEIQREHGRAGQPTDVSSERGDVLRQPEGPNGRG